MLISCMSVAVSAYREETFSQVPAPGPYPYPYPYPSYGYPFAYGGYYPYYGRRWNQTEMPYAMNCFEQ